MYQSEPYLEWAFIKTIRSRIARYLRMSKDLIKIPLEVLKCLRPYRYYIRGL